MARLCRGTNKAVGLRAFYQKCSGKNALAYEEVAEAFMAHRYGKQGA